MGALKELQKAKTKEDIIKIRLDYPNCLYCDHLSPQTSIRYYCKEKDKSFLFGERIRAKHCQVYSPRKWDLHLPLEVLTRLEEL